ncbi:hypothetical protein K501DRAFT_242976, partial [Backusella circina FSU 941]
MTEIASTTNAGSASTPVVTALLSMEICCARISDEIQELLGYYPQELAHRSLHSFISPKSSNTISRIHRYLLDNVVTTAQKVDPDYQYRNTPPTERTSSEKFFNMDPQTLCTIANGSQTFTDLLYFKRNNGSTECLQSQFCLGGGMGANLFDPSSLGSLYIICLLSKAPVACSKRESAPTEPVVLTSEPQPMSVQLVQPQPQWNMTYQEESAFNFSNENTGMSFLETPPDTTAVKDTQMEDSPANTAEDDDDDDDDYSLPVCSRVNSVYSESSVSSSSNNNSKDDVGILNYPIALSNAILSTEPNKQPFIKSLEQTNKKPLQQQSEFIKPNSVIHVAPISEKTSEDTVFFDYFKKAVQQEKKPMFDTQTSTLFRALDDIAKQDLDKKLTEEC